MSGFECHEEHPEPLFTDAGGGKLRLETGLPRGKVTEARLAAKYIVCIHISEQKRLLDQAVTSLGVEEVSFKEIQRSIGLFKALRQNGEVCQPFTSASSLCLFIHTHFVETPASNISQVKRRVLCNRKRCQPTSLQLDATTHRQCAILSSATFWVEIEQNACGESFCGFLISLQVRIQRERSSSVQPKCQGICRLQKLQNLQPRSSSKSRLVRMLQSAVAPS